MSLFNKRCEVIPPSLTTFFFCKRKWKKRENLSMKRPKIYISRLLVWVPFLMLTSLLKAEKTGLSLVSGIVLLKLEVIYLGFFDVACFL